MFIDKRIAQLGLTQQAAADRMGISQSDVSKMLRGRFENFSLERLLRLVRLLGSDVEIKVTTRRRQRVGGQARSPMTPRDITPRDSTKAG